MPIPSAAAAPAPQSGAARLSNIAAVGGLRLTKSTPMFTLYASPTITTVSRGVIIPKMARALWVAGMNGNAVRKGQPCHGRGWGDYLRGLGYVEIPHDTPVTAYGEARPSAGVSTYIDRHEANGHVQHCLTWRRPVKFGHLTRWTMDHDGYHDFRVAVMRLIHPHDLEPVQIEIATADLLSELNKLADRGDNRALRMIGERLKAIPADLALKWRINHPAYVKHEREQADLAAELGGQ